MREKIRQDCKIVLALPDMPTEEQQKEIYAWWHTLNYTSQQFVRKLAEEWLMEDNRKVAKKPNKTYE